MQFLNIGHCKIDNYVENLMEGDEIMNYRHRFGRMDKRCEKCNALKWEKETKGFCCLDGQIVLASLKEASPTLYTFLTTKDANNTPYVDKIRAYNSILAFTSLGANIDEELANAREGVYTFRIQGALYHQIGGLLPKDKGMHPTYA